jgi:hypothetical protein
MTQARGDKVTVTTRRENARRCGTASAVNRQPGTARAHGAVLVTDNLDEFPMRDVRVESLAAD